jgi:hypothetical protein
MMLKLFGPVRMVELLGPRPAPQDRGDALAPIDAILVRLSVREAERVRAHGGQVYYWLRGASAARPARVAYRWEATVDDVLGADPTPSMRARAESMRACAAGII